MRRLQRLQRQQRLRKLRGLCGSGGGGTGGAVDLARDEIDQRLCGEVGVRHCLVAVRHARHEIVPGGGTFLCWLLGGQ